jgi:16S rRNA (guanine966-N2)-methyltransferase
VGPDSESSEVVAMRITGGILRGRLITSPDGKVRPTTDMVREALFSIMGERIRGARFLDLYAGCGAVGLDAWSRGAEFVHWVELDGRTLQILKKNVTTLCDSRTRISHCDALRFVKKKLVGDRFSIIFADPPYTYSRQSKRDGPTEMLSSIGGSEMLAEDGLVVVQQGADTPAPGQTGWRMVDERVYGSTVLRFFSRMALEQGNNSR